MSNKLVRASFAASVVILSGCTGGLLLLGWTSPTWRTAWATIRHPGDAPHRLVEDAVVLLCTATLGGALLWLTASVLVCTVDALLADGTLAAGAVVRTDMRADVRAGVLRPRIVRALVATALGTVVAAGGAAAHAPREPQLPSALNGLSLPDRAHGGVRTHVARAGESLWSITAAQLPERVPAQVVARRWPRLHQLNRDRIGGDPHLIHPGTTLRLPVWGPVPTRGGNR